MSLFSKIVRLPCQYHIIARDPSPLCLCGLGGILSIVVKNGNEYWRLCVSALTYRILTIEVDLDSPNAIMDPNSAMFHQGKLQYLRRCDLYRLEKPYQTTFDTSALNGPGDNLNFVECPVVFQDAQKLRDNFHLDTNGFEFHRWPTCLTEEEFDSDSTITASYYPEITAYVAKARPASTHIHILGHQVSTRHPVTPSQTG